ncbi:MAG: PKD domain-containing protein [Propionibacteriaceae bacterium]|nr:PKD domain-containing protein [Propionibacteriaceae bacterium]
MAQGFKKTFRAAALLVTGALVATFAQFPVVARADTMPINESDPTTPVTVSADALPTVQIDGVVWTQRVIGNTVYVGGKFTTARPAGSAPGVNTVARSNLLAYDITTGNLISSWAPTTNGDVLSIVPSPDNSRLYIGGSFTQMNGQIRNRIAAVDRATGNLIGSFQPKPDATVRAIVATSDTVYMGGLLSAVSGTTRTRVASVRASDGALLSWAPDAQGGSVHSMMMSPDGTKVVIGGSFTTMNGSSNPGYGLAAVDPETGASLPFPANAQIRNAGANAAITGISSDSDSLYVSGFVFGSGGNLEGVARIDWDTLSRTWVNDCHGDTYGTYPKGDVIYTAAHSHYCGNLPDGYPQTTPWTMHWAGAYTKATLGTLKADPYGYFNWVGTPSPYLLKWDPQMTSGTFTGQGQAGWGITGNANYVTVGGEFPTAGGVAQQGLVRFAVREIAPNKVGPVFSQSKINPTVNSFVAGTVRISWLANWDRDNENLTYKLIRNGITATPIYTVNQLSSEWKRPMMGYQDSGLVPGQQYRYRLFVSDPYGNEARSDTVYVTVSADGTMSTYAQGVLDDGAVNYWRLGETPSTTVYDWAGFNSATAGAGVTGAQAGAINGDTNPASAFDGTTTGFAAANAAEQGPDTFTAEAWFNSTSTAGGKIIGFGNASTGNSTSYDRQVYLDSGGRITFGVYSGGTRTVRSPGTYRDGQWHHVVASLGSGGMALYVDGVKVGSRTDTTAGQSYTGYWRIGGDNLNSWPNRPSSYYLSGQIDDVAIYPTVLTSAQVRAHYLNSGRTLAGATPPADAYGAAVYGSEPDLYWRLAETTGTVVTDTGPNQVLGTYNGTHTKGEPSGIDLGSDTSVLFNGTTPLNGTAATQVTFTNPTVYAEELWFRTDTTTGGKLIGFSSSATGSSSSYDRHVYMLNDGKLTFGAYTGVTNTVTSTKSYNDNKWHHLVAQQSSAGMQLYVDTELVGSNAVTGAQNFTGYWRIGGDTTWGGNTTNYFRGNLDEVAVYSRTLTEAERMDHFVKGNGDLPNFNPTADFTSTVNKLSVLFDGTGSSDSDGTVASYLWDFGDGQTSTEATPAHTFAAAGPQSVTLTVTDNEGGTGSVTKTVTTIANQPPAGSFTAEVTKLQAAFTSTASDPDGTVASYLWDFGDGGSSTLANPTHTFPAVDTYSVSLTLTDNDGGTTVITNPVTTLANQAPTADFTASVNKQNVDFDAGDSTDADGTVVSYEWDFGDGSPTVTSETASHSFPAVDTYNVTLTVTDDNGATGSVTKPVTTVANASPTAAFTSTVDKLEVDFNAAGSSDSDGSVASYSWDFGDGDSGTGVSPNHTYATAGDYEVTLTVTDNQGAVGTLTKTVTAVANVKPVAAFTSNVNDLAVSFNATGSSDSDGTVASYSWDFGDGQDGTGATPSHTYASAGSYDVVLTVTDDDGATDSVTHAVEAVAPSGPIAQDAFGRTVANGWGDADIGGAWTRYGTSSLFSVASGTGQIRLATAGAGPRMGLESVSSVNTEVSVKLSLDKIPNGGGAFFSLGARVTNANGYRAKVKVAATGALTLYLVRVVNGTETTLTSTTLGSAYNYTVGSTLQIKAQVTGTSPTTTRAKVWKTTQTEPGWQLTATDSTASLQTASGISLVTYLSGSSTNVPIVASFDDLIATTP